MVGINSSVGLRIYNLPNDVISTINIEVDFKNITDTQSEQKDRIDQETAEMLFISFTPFK